MYGFASIVQIFAVSIIQAMQRCMLGTTFSSSLSNARLNGPTGTFEHVRHASWSIRGIREVPIGSLGEGVEPVSTYDKSGSGSYRSKHAASVRIGVRIRDGCNSNWCNLVSANTDPICSGADLPGKEIQFSHANVPFSRSSSTVVSPRLLLCAICTHFWTPTLTLRLSNV